MEALSRGCMGTHGVLTAYPRGVPPPGLHTGSTQRAMLCHRKSARGLNPASLELACAIDRMGWVQGVELLVTVLLARSRLLPPTVAAGVPHAELAAELVLLPSGLLAMVCEAIVKLKVRLGAACACVRACVRVRLRACLCVCVSAAWAIGEGLHKSHGACTVPVRVG